METAVGPDRVNFKYSSRRGHTKISIMSKDLLNNVGVVKRLLLKIKYEHAVDIQR